MANVWQEPIFDRTQEDVEFAMSKIAEWIANGTPTDVYDLKGCLNVSDLNRIERNIAFLAERLLGLVYPSNLFTVGAKRWDENGESLENAEIVYPNIFTKSWIKDGLPTENDIQRIINNVRSLIASFYQPPNAPSLPMSMLSYNDINSIERNLDLIKYLLDCMVSSFKKSGTFKSGSKIFLPIRR